MLCQKPHQDVTSVPSDKPRSANSYSAKENVRTAKGWEKRPTVCTIVKNATAQGNSSLRKNQIYFVFLSICTTFAAK